jgi:hypothetical protein
MRRWTIFLLLLLFSTACQTEQPTTVGFLRGNFAFIPYQERVQIIDVADETNPQFVTEFGLPGNVEKVVANGRYLYIAHSTNASSWDSQTGPPDAGLQIVDVSDPINPKMAGHFYSKSLPTDLLLFNDLLFLATWEFVDIINVKNVENPRHLGTISQGATSLAQDGERLAVGWGGCYFRTAYCEGGIRLFDFSDPERPLQVGDLQFNDLPGFDVALTDGYALVTGKGLSVIDLAGLDTLQVNGRYELNNGWLYAAQILVDGRIAYVTQYDGLHILDISQPTAPTLIGYFPTSNQLTDLALRNGRLYLTGWSGLEIINVLDPTAPQLLSYYATDYPAQIFPQPTATP